VEVVLGLAVAVVAAFGIGTVAVRWLAGRRRKREATREDPTVSAFATLAEPSRCDMIFAASALDDDGSARLLRFALDDPSETVTLAAARALVGRGLARAVDEYVARHPGERTERISRALSLVAPE
jgi:hypothetical protein